MSGHVLLRTLRETQVLVCHPQDADGDELVRHLRRIGCPVPHVWPPPRPIPSDIDVVFLLFDRSRKPAVEEGHPGFALVAVIDYEDPSMLDVLIDADVRGVVTKPVRPFGILSTLITARVAHKYEARLHQKVAKLEETLRSRRDIEKSVRILMAAQAISEDAAYQMIRREAMQKRQSMAVIASSIIAANSVFERFAGSAARDAT
ncbi:Two-component response regulator, AmiR/NasT family, consists of REC and RNA-binding antiterminator (ANTAR) domains [Rhizobiales bacterium GAS113]|nr:Two-component response regulator, AmiR/NasT family, consists of REC and RNA-binding antiterminator (ANTAR) domains [Rhizobiales bacterium GAS113]